MDIKGLVTRGTTAVIFVAVMLGGIYGGRYSFVALFALITILCLWEFFGLVLEKGPSRSTLIRKIIGVSIGLAPFVLMSILKLGWMQSPSEFILYTSILFSPFIFAVFIFELFSKSQYPFRNIAYIFLGIIYIGMPFALLDIIAFDGDDFYWKIVLGLLLMNWLNDSGAYFSGSFFGRNKLFPRVSPKKTWEGTIGGAIVTFIVAYLLSLFISDITLTQWLVLALIVSIFGTIGDLVESMFKRSINVKDSGNLLPGHGGMLDRFDAFIFIIPFATAYILWMRVLG